MLTLLHSLTYNFFKMFSNYVERKSFKYEILAAWIWLIVTWSFFFYGWHSHMSLFIATILWLYMAINIWANDIANNMWPAVWSWAIKIKWAIIIAAIFEWAWVLLAWWDVVDTISKWIIDPSLIQNWVQFIAIMMATLAWAAIWVNVATYFKAPVSTTHSIVWWLIWAWITAVWTGIVAWNKIIAIVASWVISPILWWIVAVLLLLSIRKTIMKQEERWEAAKVWVPVYIWVMVWSFSTYIISKWLNQVISGTFFDFLLRGPIALFVWYMLGIITFIFLRVYYKKQSAFFKNSKDFINTLFNIPLVFAVALLSFAHGANDVANAVWPLAAINSTVLEMVKNAWSFWGKVSVEPWIMFLWAIWLVLGLSVFGSRLIKTVWNEITKLNQIRAYCVALSAAITVIFASALWLPVSSTHIALGWVFGIGLIRQHIKREKWSKKAYIEMGMIKNIALAWIITLPASGLIAAVSYWGLSFYMK